MPDMPTYRFIAVETVDRVAWLTLNRPDVLNALHPAMLGEVIDALARLEADPGVRALVLTGAGRGFSAGGDQGFLDDLTRMTPQEIKSTVYTYFGGAAKALKLFPKPTVAAVNGAASGAGFVLALSCDFRIASPEASFHESWIGFGIIDPLGGMFLLPRLVGLSRATEMLMLGKRIEGAEAAEIGLVNETVPAERLIDHARDLAGRLADGPPLGLRAMKEGIRRGLESTMAAEWDHNVSIQSLLIGSEDFKEGVRALAEKRKPNFQGR